MAKKAFAVAGCTLGYASPVTGAPPTFTTPASLKAKATAKGIYKDQSAVLIPTGVTDGTCTTTVPGTGNMPATSVKNKVEGEFPIRVDDEVTVSAITGVLSGGGACTLNVTVQVQDAGQAKVLGE